MNNNTNNRNTYDENIHRILEKAPVLFRKFQPDELRHFLKLGHVEYYKDGDVILVESEKSINSAYLIVDGVVSIWSEEIHLADLKAGAFLGETFLFGKGARTATVKAAQDAVLLRFDRDEVLYFFRTKPERLFKIFIMNIIEIQQQKTSMMNKKMVQLKRRLLEKGDDSL